MLDRKLSISDESYFTMDTVVRREGNFLFEVIDVLELRSIWLA